VQRKQRRAAVRTVTKAARAAAHKSA
jgi:hypothetical protein